MRGFLVGKLRYIKSKRPYVRILRKWPDLTSICHCCTENLNPENRSTNSSIKFRWAEELNPVERLRCIIIFSLIVSRPGSVDILNLRTCYLQSCNRAPILRTNIPSLAFRRVYGFVTTNRIRPKRDLNFQASLRCYCCENVFYICPEQRISIVLRFPLQYVVDNA